MPWPTSSSNEFAIGPARSAVELISAAALFRAYAQSLSVDLSRQGFSEELRSLPGDYAPPGGELLLAKRGDHVLGMIALKALDAPKIAEIKRLFVRPQARNAGIGKALIAAVLQVARKYGYLEIKLDTLPDMTRAIALYQSFGFVPIPPYGSHPYPGLITMGLNLAKK